MGAGGVEGGGGGGPRLRLTACATQGGRKYMEDRVHVHVGRKSDGSVDYVYAAVYDGHGGAEASEFARRHLLWTIVGQAEFRSAEDEDVLAAIQSGFLLCHAEMRKVVHTWTRTASGFPSTSGTTASIAFVMRGKVFTGHVGDSAIVLGRRPKGATGAAARPAATALTVDHKPDSPSELQRIQEAGGQVLAKSGVMRVVWRRPLRGHSGPVRRSTHLESIPFLAVARALGDLWSYNEDSSEYVVSPRPDVDVVALDGEVESLILGSDGLWNVVRSQQSVDLVSTAEARAAARSLYINHAHCLVRNALRGWGTLRADNITAIVLHFDSAAAPASPDAAPDALLLAQTDLCPDAALLEHPAAVYRLEGSATPQLLQAEPVELVYAGNMDPPLSAILSRNKGVFDFQGPGFTNYTVERAGEQRRLSNAQQLPLSARFSLTGAAIKGATVRLSAPVAGLKAPTTPLSRSSSERKESGGGPTPLTRSATAPGRKRQSPGDENKAGEGAKRLDLGASFAHGTLPSPAAAAAGLPDGVHITRAPLPAAAQQSTSQAQPPRPDAASLGLKSKPKFVCRKHGYDCAKVKKMNLEYDRKRHRHSRSKSPQPEEASEPEPTTASHHKRPKASPPDTGSETESVISEAPASSRLTRSAKRRQTPAPTARSAKPSHHLRSTPRRKSGATEAAGVRKCRSAAEGGAWEAGGLEAEAPEEEPSAALPFSRPLGRSPIRPERRRRASEEGPAGPSSPAPPAKRHKLWNSLVSFGRILSASVTATEAPPKAHSTH